MGKLLTRIINHIVDKTFNGGHDRFIAEMKRCNYLLEKDRPKYAHQISVQCVSPKFLKRIENGYPILKRKELSTQVR